MLYNELDMGWKERLRRAEGKGSGEGRVCTKRGSHQGMEVG